MEITVKRTDFTEKSTISDLSIDGQFVCYILEDKDRQGDNPWDSSMKIPKETAIPKGTYEVAVTFSNHFQKMLPLIMGVPDYEGVRIHSGNRPKDTEGCLLTGTHKAPDSVIGSREAFDKIFPMVQEAIKTEKVFITIS